MRREIPFGLGNYYGSVVAVEKGGTYSLELENYADSMSKPISEEFFRAIEKEFGAGEMCEDPYEDEEAA